MSDEQQGDGAPSENALEFESPVRPPDGAGSADTERGPDVFISYRLDPDQPTALALKKLIEGSLEPAPKVFVSGSGGIRPSNIGLRPQLQRAVSAARAFVGVITPHSKEREWVIFEAGAAWGRGQFYAPVLIDTEPEEMGTTIADFVATKADARDQMALLVQTIATTLGSAVKSHFGTRYSAFERYLEQRAKKPDQDSADSPKGRGASYAMQLWYSGRRDEANKAFDAAEADALDDEARASTKIIRLNLLHADEPEEFRRALARMDEATRATGEWAVWSGITEPRDHVAITHFERALTIPTARDYDLGLAIQYRAERLFRLGRDEEAASFLMEHVASNVTTARRTALIKVLWDECTRLSPLAKLMLAASAASEADADMFKRLTDLAIEQKWPAIAIFAARVYRRKSDSSSAMNSLGRAYHAAGYLSLAHDAYREAAAAGASVAKVNLALCMAYSGVPAAALALLKEHVGDFDAAAPDFPHRTRADVEQLVAAETSKVGAVWKTGSRALGVLAELVDASLAAPSGLRHEGPLEATDGDGAAVQLSALYPFPNLFEGGKAGAFYGLFVGMPGDPTTFRGVHLDLSEGGVPKWTVLRRVEPLALEPRPPAPSG